jgi:hypothetical protein
MSAVPLLSYCSSCLNISLQTHLTAKNWLIASFEAGTRVLVVNVTWSHQPDDSNQGTSGEIVPSHDQEPSFPVVRSTHDQQRRTTFGTCVMQGEKEGKSDLWVRFPVKECAISIKLSYAFISLAKVTI